MLVSEVLGSVLEAILEELRRRIGTGCHDRDQATTIFWFDEAPKADLYLGSVSCTVTTKFLSEKKLQERLTQEAKVAGRRCFVSSPSEGSDVRDSTCITADFRDQSHSVSDV